MIRRRRSGKLCGCEISTPSRPSQPQRVNATMETSLHRQLKEVYAGESGELEVKLGGYRIDVRLDDELIEIQHGSLSAIRDKIRKLTKSHPVRVVKPIIERKQLVKMDRAGGEILETRRSPKRGTLLDLFDELVYFTRAFPHENLTLEVVLVHVDELRYPGHGRRRRRRSNDFQVEDQRLVSVSESHAFRTADDLLGLLPSALPSPFDTAQLAEALDIQRWVAQRIAYCLRETGATSQVGKKGNSLLYRRAA